MVWEVAIEEIKLKECKINKYKWWVLGMECARKIEMLANYVQNEINLWNIALLMIFSGDLSKSQ